MTFEQAYREYQNRTQKEPGSTSPPAYCEGCKEWYIMQDERHCPWENPCPTKRSA